MATLLEGQALIFMKGRLASTVAKAGQLFQGVEEYGNDHGSILEIDRGNP